MKNMKKRVLLSIQKHFRRIYTNLKIDKNGYFEDALEATLLPGIEKKDFEADFEKGNGNELYGKIRAVYSSSALAVNCFACLKRQSFPFGPFVECSVNQFEKKYRNSLRGANPNLDMQIESRSEIILVETKFTEYFQAKKAKFSTAYSRENLAYADEECWWKVKELCESGRFGYLDAVQLFKHYIGLSKFKADNNDRNVVLCYLYWTPTNAGSIDVCQMHSSEIELLKSTVVGSKIKFISVTYHELWGVWLKIPALRKHAEACLERYSISVD